MGELCSTLLKLEKATDERAADCVIYLIQTAHREGGEGLAAAMLDVIRTQDPEVDHRYGAQVSKF